jgi:hypothetical protein
MVDTGVAELSWRIPRVRGVHVFVVRVCGDSVNYRYCPSDLVTMDPVSLEKRHVCYCRLF